MKISLVKKCPLSLLSEAITTSGPSSTGTSLCSSVVCDRHWTAPGHSSQVGKYNVLSTPAGVCVGSRTRVSTHTTCQLQRGTSFFLRGKVGLWLLTSPVAHVSSWVGAGAAHLGSWPLAAGPHQRVALHEAEITSGLCCKQGNILIKRRVKLKYWFRLENTLMFQFCSGSSV